MSDAICIDARCVGERMSGIERYTLGLIEGLAEIAPQRRIVALARDVERVETAGRGAVEVVRCAHGPMTLRGQREAPRAARTAGAALVHVPYVNAPLGGHDLPVTITVHDLIPQRVPHLLRRSWKTRLAPAWRVWCRLQCRRATRIVTVSEFSAAELRQYAGIDAGRIDVVHNGVTRGETDLDEAALRRRFEIEGPFVSTVGRHDPYKNVAVLIEAMAEVSGATLVVAGGDDPRYSPALREHARAYGVSDRVVFAGYVDEATRVALLRFSAVFAFPSGYEGFGLPPLEAMLEGCPVVACRTGPMPEVLGDAAVLVEPGDASALAAGITALLDDVEAARRRDEGARHAATFTWRRSAEKHLDVFERVLKSSATRRAGGRVV